MLFPDPHGRTPMPRYHGCDTAEANRRFHRRDSQVRRHNLARHVAAMPTREVRQVFLDGMKKFHKPAFMAQFMKLLAWYWRRQRQTKPAGA